MASAFQSNAFQTSPLAFQISGSPPVIINVGGAGEVPSWREHLEAVHRKRVLERDLLLYGKRLKKTVLAIRAAEKKVATAKSSPPDGILANLWRLAEKKEELKLQIQRFKQEITDIETMLISAQLMKDYDEDEDDIEALLLS